ncbi:MAG: hypothetical protein PVH25_14405 [Burkholderiales bacterium]|jgi:hypothetical protein
MSFEKSRNIRAHVVFPKLLASVLAGVALSTSALTAWSQDDPATVKMSKSGICHDASSRHYERLKNFKAYPSLQACLEDGGRAPKK